MVRPRIDSSGADFGGEYRLVTLEDCQHNPTLSYYLELANESLGFMGYTEHGFRHANLVAHISQNVLRRLGYPDREAELAAIAGYLHDVGNLIGREMHSVASALLAREELVKMGMPPQEVAVVMNAIGSHEEETGTATSRVSAATILADKSDVHRSRVQNPDMKTFDIHDRVNYAARKSFLRVQENGRIISLELEIDTEVSQVMEYFEIFLSRMVMCRRAAEFLDCKFQLVINGNQLL